MSKSPHVVSFVFNKVEGDSRVIKTAQAAMNMGCTATIVGIASVAKAYSTEVEGVPVRLIPNYAANLKKHGLWGSHVNKDLRLLIGGQMQSAVAEILALQPDLVHSHDMIGLKIGASVMKACNAAGTPIHWIHDLHEYVAGLKGDLAEIYMPICLAWERELLYQADALVTVSDALAEKVRGRYRLGDLPNIVYNAPYAKAFVGSGLDIRSYIGLSAEVPLVVFVGGATALRGCPTIIEGVSKCDGVHLAFVSQGPYVDEMKELAATLGMGDRFHTHPYVDSDQVSNFIRTADIGIHGLVHYPNAEVALPNKLFEYLHARLPVVVSDVESMKDFVENYGVGSVFEAENSDDCAKAIHQALSSRQELQAKISEDLLQKFSWEEQEIKLQKLYADLISQNKQVSDATRESAALWEKVETTLFESVYARALSETAARSTQVEALTGVGPKLLKSLSGVEASLQKKLAGTEDLLMKVHGRQGNNPARPKGYIEKFLKYGPRASFKQACRRIVRFFRPVGR